MTSLVVRPLTVTDLNELTSLIEGHLTALEPGLSLLERRFPAGETLVDFVALDARGRLVLLMLGLGSDIAMLVQALEAYGWCRESGALLERLFPGARRMPGTPPRLFLLAARFSDSLRRTARQLGPLAPTLVECRPVEVNGARGVCFEVVEGVPTDVGSAAPERADDPARERVRQLVSHLERLSFREAFR